ncbi:MAG: hypothetical protein ACOCUW_00425, partial [Gemmatimonadota bacterium]
MEWTRRRITVMALAAVLVALGCADGPAGERAAAAAEREPVADTAPAQAPARDPSAVTRAALPGLFGIMLKLERDAYRVSRGLWAARLDTIAAGARSIANHPRLIADELRVMRAVLGDDMIRLQELHARVQQLAVRLEEEALAGDLEAAFTTDAELRAGCMECHDEFRDRLRRGVRETAAAAGTATPF